VNDLGLHQARLKTKHYLSAKWQRLHDKLLAMDSIEVSRIRSNYWEFVLKETSRGDLAFLKRDEGLPFFATTRGRVLDWSSLLADIPDIDPVIKEDKKITVRETSRGKRPPTRGKVMPYRTCRMCGHMGRDEHVWNACRPPGKQSLVADQGRGGRRPMRGRHPSKPSDSAGQSLRMR
jgi:hypothetical protein